MLNHHRHRFGRWSLEVPPPAKHTTTLCRRMLASHQSAADTQHIGTQTHTPGPRLASHSVQGGTAAHGSERATVQQRRTAAHASDARLSAPVSRGVSWRRQGQLSRPPDLYEEPPPCTKVCEPP
mmetsp:Transcript_72176/g.191833  ORF Transcript_72176/g.191833 Transcript_72176/m.191833 type:complete len:124 (-) Transcript_72176:334-705(-)